MEKLLSISIPTYNRSRELSEIIDALLTVESDDFEIVVTDNVSTDDTERTVRAYSDPRVRYFRNDGAIPPFMNMIHSIWNAQGKYAMHCNDRDILIPERFPALLDFLRGDDYAFVWAPAQSSKKGGVTRVFDGEFDSLMHHAVIHHPTGMVFNRELIGAHLREQDYEQYQEIVNTYDFLMMDLLPYGKSAIYGEGYWAARPAEYIKKNRSGTRVYFSPEMREAMFYGVADHLLFETERSFDAPQREALLKKLYEEFLNLFCKYKLCMADPNETAHYGLDVRFISTAAIEKAFLDFLGRSLSHLREKGCDPALAERIAQQRGHYKAKIAETCLKIDAIVAKKRLRRLIGQ